MSFTSGNELQDGKLAWAGITCNRLHELLRRQDSNPSQRNKYSLVTSVVMENYDCSLSASDLTLNPGINHIQVLLKVRWVQTLPYYSCIVRDTG